jgi:hypothetical protein
LQAAARKEFIDAELNDRLATMLERQREARAAERARIKAEEAARKGMLHAFMCFWYSRITLKVG